MFFTIPNRLESTVVIQFNKDTATVCRCNFTFQPQSTKPLKYCWPPNYTLVLIYGKFGNCEQHNGNILQLNILHLLNRDWNDCHLYREERKRRFRLARNIFLTQFQDYIYYSKAICNSYVIPLVMHGKITNLSVLSTPRFLSLNSFSFVREKGLAIRDVNF